MGLKHQRRLDRYIHYHVIKNTRAFLSSDAVLLVRSIKFTDCCSYYIEKTGKF